MIYFRAFLLSISFIMLYSLATAQADSLYRKHFLDSLKQVSILEKQAQIEALKSTRIAFLKELETYPSDSAFKLDISNLGFEIFPDISRFTHITYIQASGNRLKKLSLAKKNIHFLKVLDIRDNNIAKLKLGKAPNLKSVYLGTNPLRHIPNGLLFSGKIKMIDLSKTQIAKLPWWMKYKKSITKLLISEGEFTLSAKNIRRMRHLKTLQLARIKIDSLPRSFSKLQNLERLTIAYCRLHKLPNNFGELKRLNTLILYSDAFTELPEVVFQLPSLVHLDFYYNSIRSIPTGISQLKKLEHLYLSFNQISVLPPDIQELHNLKSLHVHHNNIEIAPVWLAQLKRLQILDMGFNDIEILPNLSSLDTLKEVDFQANKLRKFPFQLLELPNTRLLFLSNNPFEMTKDELRKLSQLSKTFAARKGQLILVKK